MIVQLCLHNVATMKNEVAILVGMATYSKGCVAHCLNLLWKDWRKTLSYTSRPINVLCRISLFTHPIWDWKFLGP